MRRFSFVTENTTLRLTEYVTYVSSNSHWKEVSETSKWKACVGLVAYHLLYEIAIIDPGNTEGINNLEVQKIT